VPRGQNPTAYKGVDLSNRRVTGPRSSTISRVRLLKASVLALRRHPRANATFSDDRFALHPRVNVAVAVAADDALIAPVAIDGELGIRPVVSFTLAADHRSLYDADADAARFLVETRGLLEQPLALTL
jgi:pyruvate/2-oxoglutarate dehydrogenase complex dihydrolipoamide acyltransferase (E2) component